VTALLIQALLSALELVAPGVKPPAAEVAEMKTLPVSA
jgi:hypothetical protein